MERKFEEGAYYRTRAGNPARYIGEAIFSPPYARKIFEVNLGGGAGDWVIMFYDESGNYSNYWHSGSVHDIVIEGDDNEQ